MGLYGVVVRCGCMVWLYGVVVWCYYMMRLYVVLYDVVVWCGCMVWLYNVVVWCGYVLFIRAGDSGYSATGKHHRDSISTGHSAAVPGDADGSGRVGRSV